MQFNPEDDRFGSSRFATDREIAQARMFNQALDSLFVGFRGRRPLFFTGLGGIILVAGARAGKLTTILGYNACHSIARHTLVLLDVKGEIAAISQDQTPDEKFCYYWNPARLHGLPYHRLNPLDYVVHGSPTLVSDVKVLCENLIPPSGAAQAEYFESRAREYLEGLILALVEQRGVLMFPDLYYVVNLIPAGGEAWLDFAFAMSESGHPMARRVEAEIAEARDSSGSGFQGIVGETFKALSPLSDPTLMAAVSPPFDFSMADLCKADQRCQLYLMPPAEFVQAWSPVIKAICVAGMIHKARAPEAPKQTWILDECGQLGSFPLVPKLYTYGAGIGIQPFAVFQTAQQMDLLAPRAGDLIRSSASAALYFSIRDLTSASEVSRMLGAETLTFDDTLAQDRARLAKTQALQAILSGRDPFAAGLEAAHHARAAQHRTKQRRDLRLPDEVMRMGADQGYLFADGLPYPALIDRRPYFNETFMAGRFFSNPYHPPKGRVRVKKRFGWQVLREIRAQVPSAFAHYPQHRDGTWNQLRR